MNAFAGTWVDNNGDSINVTENGNLASLTYSNSRGPFNGFEVDLNAPVLNVHFADSNETLAGVLVSGPGTRAIAWSNGTTWHQA